MANKIPCPQCDKKFRSETGRDWHLYHIHNPPKQSLLMNSLKAPGSVATAKVMTEPGPVAHMARKHGKDYKDRLLNVPRPMSLTEAEPKASLLKREKLGLYQSMQELLVRIESGKKIIQHLKNVGDTKTLELYERVQADLERHDRLFKERANEIAGVELADPNHAKRKIRDTLIFMGDEVYLR
jgi:hypothetical protein